MNPREIIDYIVIDDVDEDISFDRLESFKKSHKKWIEYYFPHFSEENFSSHRNLVFTPGRSYGKNALIKSLLNKRKASIKLNLKVKKRYSKCPKITKRESLSLTLKIN